MNNGVFQDHAFASITETPGDASDDGYAICVNAVTSEAIAKNGLQPTGFTILKVDRLGNPQWWNLFWNSVMDDPAKANKLTGSNIIYYSESTGSVRRMMVCGKVDEDIKAVRKCATDKSGAKKNIMLAIVSPNGVPQALYDYASPKTEYSIRTDVHNDAAFSLVQVPPTGTDPDLRRYSDRGVTLFGSRYASIFGERGLAENEHQGWVMRLMFRNGIANMPMVEASSSVGHDNDDHFVSGVVFESDGGTYLTFGLGHTASGGYRNSTTLPMDMDTWVARLNHDLLYDDGTCGSVKVPYCEAKLQLLAAPFTYDICDRGEFWLRNPNYCVRREIREEVNCP